MIIQSRRKKRGGIVINPVHVQLKLFSKQKAAYESYFQPSDLQMLYGGAAGGGKTRLLATLCTELALTYPGTRWLIGRSVLSTLKKTTLYTLLEVFQKVFFLTVKKDYKFNQKDNIIQFSNGSEILLMDLAYKPSDPDYNDLGSLELTGAFIDEVNEISKKCKDIIFARIRYRNTELNIPRRMFMSCNPAKNWVKIEFFDPWAQGQLDDDKVFIQALPSDNPHLPKGYVEAINKMDKVTRERYLGNWNYADDDSALFDFDTVNYAWNNDEQLEKDMLNEEEIYITVDPSRFGKDTTKIYVWAGWSVVHRVVIKKSSTQEVSVVVENLANEYGVKASNILIDEVGIGAGIVDFGKFIGFNGSSSAIKEASTTENQYTRPGGKSGSGSVYLNLRAQCYYYLAAKFRTGTISLARLDLNADNKKAVIDELLAMIAWNVDRSDKLQIIPKDHLKKLLGRSPDDADALSMRAYFDLRRKVIRQSSVRPLYLANLAADNITNGNGQLAGYNSNTAFLAIKKDNQKAVVKRDIEEVFFGLA
jgi:phage terminase large subunit